MLGNAGLAEVARIRQALKNPPAAGELEVVKLIRDAAGKNKLADAIAALPPYTPDEIPHPAIASGRAALEGLAMHVGKISGELKGEHVLAVHDLLEDAGIHPRVVEMIGVHLMPLIDAGEVKVSQDVMDFSLDSAAMWYSSAASALAAQAVMKRTLRIPNQIVPDDVRAAEIDALASEMQRPGVFQKSITQFRLRMQRN